MARFYGTLQGARGPTSRLGHRGSGLEATAQSYTGDVVVTMYAQDDGDTETDCVRINVRHHGGPFSTVCLFDGPIKDLLEKDGRKAIMRAFAEEALRERSE